MVSTPCAASSAGRVGLLKRATAMMRRRVPRRSAARRAKRANDGPILPPTPKIKSSPSSAAIASASASVGLESCSSSSARSLMSMFAITRAQNLQSRKSYFRGRVDPFREPCAEDAVRKRIRVRVQCLQQ